MKEQSIFCQRLRLAQTESGISMQCLSNTAGYSCSTVHSYFRDERDSSPKLEMVERLAKVLDVNPAWLAGWSENKKRI